tara:strand:+ start:6701 stop:7522 length:822 start_codon:yes stop_codon:yes gene_type:complete
MSNQVNETTKYTLTYDNGIKGFPSFYSYFPDWMIGMNNYFYTFKGGNLYRHNTNPVRNRYYGINYSSTMQSVFNDIPLENKLFKTINLEGDDSWGTTLVSEQQDDGFILAPWYAKKEGAYFAFVRNDGTTPAQLSEYALRSLNGIGTSANIVVTGTTTTVSFPVTMPIGNIISVGTTANNDGDMLYFGNPNPLLLGRVIQVNQDFPAGINNIVVDNTIGSPAPTTTEYILYIKNSIVESHGILGKYGVFTLTNSNTEKVELFSVETEVMKSFP